MSLLCVQMERPCQTVGPVDIKKLYVFAVCSGGASLSDCWPCSAGFYCGNPGLSAPTALCQRGYYCPGLENITVPDPPNFKCPPGE